MQTNQLTRNKCKNNELRFAVRIPTDDGLKKAKEDKEKGDKRRSRLRSGRQDPESELDCKEQ